VLPWSQFLYAEVAPDSVRAVFSRHDVVVTACGLEAPLVDCAAHIVTALLQRHEPSTSGSRPLRAS
jgi:hypothetical protein